MACLPPSKERNSLQPGWMFPSMTFSSEKIQNFSAALNEHFDGLYAYAMVLSRNRTEAEDLVQETCVRAMQAIGRLRPDSNVKSWLFTILRNIWLNQLRQRRTALTIELEGGDSTAELAVETSKGPHEQYVSKMERDQVREAIQQLSVESREVILLREYEELSYQEIAILLDCPTGTVMSRLGRARSKLRALLSETLQVPGPRAKGAAE
jgi:RNA polymerase sigma-70 factor (ECF subfamily)